MQGTTLPTTLANVKLPVAGLLMMLGCVMAYVYWGTPLGQPGPAVFDSQPITTDPEILRQYLEHIDRKPSHERHRTHGTWYSFKNPYEFYVYTAFYDDRKSLGSLPVVRLIAVSEYLDADNREAWCKLTYDDGKFATIRVEFLAIGAGVGRHGKGFREYVLHCPLQDELVPVNVSIVPHQQDNPTFILPVELPLRKKVKENFVVCVSVTYWHQDPHRIVEWMELLRIFGANKVTIYNNTLDAESSRIFNHYHEQDGLVDFRNSHSFVDDPGELTLHMHMSPVINDCMYRNMHAYRKVIVTDLDELIVPRLHMNYADMLQEIDKRDHRSHPARHYVFRNDYFFFDFEDEKDESKYLLTLKHQTRIPPSGPGYSVKSIIDPQACTNMHNHYCWGTTPLYNKDGGSIDVDPDIGMNQHYKKCHLDKYEHPGRCVEIMKDKIHDNTMLRFKSMLVPRVTEKLKILNLDPL